MSLGLEALASSFQGLIPAVLFTASREGIPNAAYISHVEYVDSAHVALSFQFFNKSRKNIAENPQAAVHLIDPDTQQGYVLHLRYVRSDTSGPVFERMALRIEAIASYCGLKGIFKLLAADIYEVVSLEKSAEEPACDETLAVVRRQAADPLFTMKALQDLSERVRSAGSLEQLLDSILAGLEEVFGFTHSMILLAGEEPNTLVMIASRGYPEAGAGAEVRMGEGIVGMVAEARKPIRIAGLIREMLYALAVRKRAQEAGQQRIDARIALPGMANPESQLGVPLVVRGELIGVLCIESEIQYRFHEEDKTSIEMLGTYLALAIQNMQLHERADAADAAEASAGTAPADTRREAAATAHAVAFYPKEECIMVDGEYLIRSLPARILWKLLTTRERDGRHEFTNRELRLDKSLNLPEWKDNLETRLLLLRRRLEQKCPDIRIAPRGRGRFALEVSAGVTLTEHA